MISTNRLNPIGGGQVAPFYFFYNMAKRKHIDIIRDYEGDWVTCIYPLIKEHLREGCDHFEVSRSIVNILVDRIIRQIEKK